MREEQIPSKQIPANRIPSIADEIAVLLRLATSPRAKNSMIASMDRSAYILLGKLDANGPLAVNALADEFRLDISTASRQISAMESKGLVERLSDPENGRISLLQITPHGHDRLYEVRQARYAVYREILRDWSDEELLALETSLMRLNRDMKAWKTREDD